MIISEVMTHDVRIASPRPTSAGDALQSIAEAPANF